MRGVIRSSSGTTIRQTDEELREIANFWSQLRACEELDATLWGVLEPLERGVTEAMRQFPPDLVGMRSATARAMAYLTDSDMF
jgi:hypothetical protein